MTRLAALMIAVLALGGCGVRPTGVVYAGDGPVATASASPRSVVFFLRGGVLTPVERTVSPADPQSVFDALFRGPTPAERRRGLRTALSGDQRAVVEYFDGKPVLIETTPATAPLPSAGFAQIYCTGLALPDPVRMKLPYRLGHPDTYTSDLCPGVRVDSPSPTPLAGKPTGTPTGTPTG